MKVQSWKILLQSSEWPPTRSLPIPYSVRQCPDSAWANLLELKQQFSFRQLLQLLHLWQLVNHLPHLRPTEPGSDLLRQFLRWVLRLWNHHQLGSSFFHPRVVPLCLPRQRRVNPSALPLHPRSWPEIFQLWPRLQKGRPMFLHQVISISLLHFCRIFFSSFLKFFFFFL